MSESILKQQIRDRAWYAIHTYSGYEKAVSRNLTQRAHSLGVQDKIFNVFVAMEKKVKIKGGKRSEVEENVYPGYVFVDMIVDDETWYIVRNTPRVTGFVGSGIHPVPVSNEEVEKLIELMREDGEKKHVIDLSIDEVILITDGPFKEFEGRVQEVDTEKGKVKVLVSMFGRETPVELDFLQIKKI